MRRLSILLTAWGFALLGLVTVAPPAQASFPPGTNGKIVYGGVFPNFGVTINPDGSDSHQVGPVGSTTCTTWSPNSSKVLCNLWSADGAPQPATANPDGSGFTLLNHNLPFDLFCLNGSPDGRRLLCHSEGMANPADAGLYTVRSSDAGDPVRVTTTVPGGFDNGYGYSPDGSRILYARFDSGGPGTLFSVKPDGSDPIQLSPSSLSVIDLSFFDQVGADWSPDSSKVAFAAFSSRARFSSGLFVVNADGTGLRQITPKGVGALSAQWSPNGAMIGFTSCSSLPGNCGIPQAWVVRPDGKGLRQVTPSNDSAFLTPVWSPDSTKLLLNELTGETPRDLLQVIFEGNNPPASLWTIGVDGSGLSKLADTAALSVYKWGSAPAEEWHRVAASPFG
jgi:Tol biopolymer transport system component